MKRVAFFIGNNSVYSGGCYMAYQVITALMKLGYEVVVYSNKVPVFLRDFKYYGRIQHFIVNINKREEIKDIYADIYWASPVAGTLAGGFLSRKYNKPLYTLVFDSLPDLKKRISPAEYEIEKVYFEPVAEYFGDNGTRAVACSRYTAKGFEKWVGVKPVAVLHPCVNTEAMKNKIVGRDDKGVLFISRLVKRKRFDELLYIADRSRHRINIITSMFEGDSLERIGRHKNIKIHNTISDERKFGLLSKCLAVISTSVFEGFGMYAIEAYSMGKPLIAKDLPTFREIKGEQHRIVANNADEIVNEINSLEYRQYLSNTHYSFNNFVERLSAIMEKYGNN